MKFLHTTALFCTILSGTVSAQTPELSLSLGKNITWQTEADKTYQLQWSDENQLIWNNLTEVRLGDDLEQEFYDPNFSSGRTYRVLEVTSASVGRSVLSNSGFETGTNSVASSWGTSNGTFLYRSSEEAHTGTYSIHSILENVDNSPTSTQLSQTTSDSNNPIVGGASYDLTFWVKETRSGVSYVQQYEIQWLNSSDQVIGTSGATAFDTATNIWNKVRASGLVAPTDATKARAVFSFTTGAVTDDFGEVFFDDVTLIDTNAPLEEPETTVSRAVTVEQSVQLNWTTTFGRPYQIFTGTDLATWEPFGEEIEGDGTLNSIIISGDSPQRFYRVQFSGDNPIYTNIVSLFNSRTTLEPEILVETDEALFTYMGDRARDRHAREDMFEAYDHYLTWYWEERTLELEIVDKVAKGGSEIVFNYTTQGALDAPEFRAFFRGINTVAEYNLNLSAELVGPKQYTATISSNETEKRPLQLGDRIELEISQFLDSPANGRSNYYGTTFLYIVGEGVVPWEGKGDLLDSFPLPTTAWLGGLTTLPYQYSNEPDDRFKQTAGNIAPVSIQPFMQGRRLHHTDFDDGSHSEPGNPDFTEHAGKAGPQFIAQSCVSCHVNNGRSLSPAIGEPFLQGVVKVGTRPTGTAHPILGSVLQPASTNGSSEGNITIDSYTTTHGTYGDGTPYTLRKPNFSFDGTTPSHFSVRYSQQLVGLGLLEAIDENTILALADPEDTDEDGISGKPQTITDPVTGDVRLGRFTSKAGKASISNQIAAALNTDMGITTSTFPVLDDGSTTNTPEISDDELEELTRYISLIGVSARRNLEDPKALQGETIFNSIGCTDCHTPTMTTGRHHPMAELRNQSIHAFTDLLLHDMGEGLADNMGEEQASGAEWRTAPLWNIGLTEGISGGESYLHDGRARTLEEAILWHGGEGKAAKENFRTSDPADRDALIKFLKSL